MVFFVGSGILGVLVEWILVFGMEIYIFVIFLDLNVDDFSFQDNFDDLEVGGWDVILIGEEEEEFFELQIVKQYDGEVKVEVFWDFVVYGCFQFSKGMFVDEWLFLIVCVMVQFSYLVDM